MINRKSVRGKRHNYIPRYSDADILQNVINTELWRLIYLRDSKAAWIVLKAILNLKVEMFAAPLRAVLRINHGKRTIGVVIYLLSLLMLIAFNANYVVSYLCTFLPFLAPLLPFLLSGEQLLDAMFVSIHSRALLFFWILYGVLAPLHMIFTFKGWNTCEGEKVHGTSLIHLLLSKKIKVSQAVSKVVLEPLLVLIGGLVLIIKGLDVSFGVFLIISALCLFGQELRNSILQYTKG